MSEPRRPGPAASARTVRLRLAVSLGVVLFLATVGSLGAGFGVLTACTDTYGCTTSSCRPCSTTGAWLELGWAGQGVLLLAGAVLAVLAVRRSRSRAVRLGAVLLGPAGVVLFAATTFLAVRST